MQGEGVPLLAERMPVVPSLPPAGALALRDAVARGAKKRGGLLTRCSDLCIILCSPVFEQLSVSAPAGFF